MLFGLPAGGAISNERAYRGMNIVSSHIKEEIRSRCDIVDVIGSYLTLQQKGRSYHALCPFHTEKTASFVVNPNKQIFHCFGCGAGGDVFSFVVKYQNISFYEALKILADRCGVQLPKKQQTGQELHRLEEQEQLLAINELAVLYFKQSLKNQQGTCAREYLVSRGVSDQWVERFSLGYAPSGWSQLLQDMVNRGYTPQKLQLAGLVIPRSKGEGYYDRFRHRLMFPIYNPRGKVIGFGGRSLDEEQNPKYLNSPDTPLYHKGEGFYGLNWAREEIGKKGQAIIVEGYFDLIMTHLHGFTNVVATLGTAITQAQVRQLRQWAKEVIIFFDSDNAGISAAMRSWSLFLESGLRVRVATLGVEGDPDSYLRANGAADLQECIDKAVNLLDFVIEQSIVRSKLDGVEGKVECLNKILPVLASINNRVERTSYLNKLADRLNIEEGILLQELRKVVQTGRRKLDKPESMSGVTKGSAIQLAEKMLIQLMIYYPSTKQSVLAKLNSDDFTSSVYAKIFNTLQGGGTTDEEVDIASLMDQLEDEAAKTFVSSVAMEHEHFENVERVAFDCIKAIQRNKLKARLKDLQSRIKSTSDKQALSEYEKLIKTMKTGEFSASI